MKAFKVILSLLLFCMKAQAQTSAPGTYYFSSTRYSECIELAADGSFIYHQNDEFVKTEVRGNWQIRKDSVLVLDSRPQRTKLAVYESHKRGAHMTFRVRYSDNNSLVYNIYLINVQGDTVRYASQFDKTVLRGKIVSFFIRDTKGLQSPLYRIQSTRTNFFDIRFEQHRVFESEEWKFDGRTIIPRGLDNAFVHYSLVKK
ncbi:MAG: hypothetical protein EOO01_32725 [Chitinophagaceae bacterium]|nr:MAG: hypothetical protein EOO01_32725 [Chitinophagaceae bacterium]